MWPLAAATGWTFDYIRWEVPLAEVFRARHAQLWLGGAHCKRAGLIGSGAKARRRARFDTLARKYHGPRH